MFTARTMMFSWVPACLKHSASPTFLCSSSCAHEPCSSGQGWCKEELGEGACSGHSREAGSAGEPATRVGHPRGPGRRAGLCHFTLPGNTTTFAAQRRSFRGRGFVRQRPRRIPQPRAASVLPEQEQRAGSFQRVCGSASFWSAVCGRCCGTGAAKTPTWCPFFLVHEVLESHVEKNSGEVSSFAAIPQQLWSVKRNFCAKHGIKDDLTLGLGLHGDGIAHQKRKTVECFSWNVLGSHSAECYLFGLVEKDAWRALGQLRFQH